MRNELVRFPYIEWFACRPGHVDVQADGLVLGFKVDNGERLWAAALDHFPAGGSATVGSVAAFLETVGLTDERRSAGNAKSLAPTHVEVGAGTGHTPLTIAAERLGATKPRADVRCWLTVVGAAAVATTAPPCSNCLELRRRAGYNEASYDLQRSGHIELAESALRFLVDLVANGHRSDSWLVSLRPGAYLIAPHLSHAKCPRHNRAPFESERRLVDPLSGPVRSVSRLKLPWNDGGPPSVTAVSYSVTDRLIRRIIGIGKGANEEARVATALGEVVERMHFFNDTADITSVSARALGDTAIVAPDDASLHDAPRAWRRAIDLFDGSSVLIPHIRAGACWHGRRPTTSGWSAHPSRSGAIVRALLELLENDAVLRARACSLPLTGVEAPVVDLVAERLDAAGMVLRRWAPPARVGVSVVMSAAVAETSEWLPRGAFVESSAAHPSLAAAANNSDLGVLQAVEQLTCNLRLRDGASRLLGLLCKRIPNLSAGASARLQCFGSTAGGHEAALRIPISTSEEDMLERILGLIGKAGLRAYWVDATSSTEGAGGMTVGRAFIPALVVLHPTPDLPLTR